MLPICFDGGGTITNMPDLRIYRSVLMLSLAALCAGAADSRLEDTFDYFINNWNVIGLPDYIYGSRITPESEMYLSGGAVVQVRTGRKLEPLKRAQGKRALEGWMPIILVDASDGPVRYEITWWATPLPDSRQWQQSFRWPVESENYLNWIRVRATNTSTQQALAQADIRPRQGGYKEKIPQFMGGGKHLREYSWKWTLAPGASAEAVARYPYFPVADPVKYDGADAGLWLDRTIGFWRGTMAEAAAIQVPCRKATQALLAAHVCQMIANDLGDLRGGEGFYDTFYIRDGAYQIMELEEAGLNRMAARAINRFLARQRYDGRFESQEGQFDANGQAVWALWQYARIVGDRDFLARVYPRMLQAVSWAMWDRRRAPASSPFAGLLSPAPADGEHLWDGKHHIVGYDLWNLRGILSAADAARRLGKAEDAKALFDEAASYREAIDAAWKRTGLAYFPPSWEKDGTHWGNTETLWPTRLFAATDPRIKASSDFLRKDFEGGFVEGTIRWKAKDMEDAIHPYMGAYTVMDTLARGDGEQVVEDFYWYLVHSTAANAFPEGIYSRRRFAWSDTIPHATGAANYAILLRHMLVDEDGHDLHLLPAVPDWWLEDGREIRIERLPTHFGVMDLLVRGTKAGVDVHFTAPLRERPKHVVLHLPQSRPLGAAVPGVAVAVRPSQKQRWDFETVVRRLKH